MAEFFFSLLSPGRSPARENDVRTGFLYVDPSALAGAGRIFDLWGGFDIYTISRGPAEADLRAMYADWRVVGQDVRDATIRTAQLTNR